MKLYFNPNCSKSRAALELLKEKVSEENIEVIEYLKKYLSIEEIKSICDKLNIQAIELIRNNEEEYKKLVKKKGIPNNNTAIEWMSKHPIIIERPILVNENKAIIGRPPENILKIIKL